MVAIRPYATEFRMPELEKYQFWTVSWIFSFQNQYKRAWFGKILISFAALWGLLEVIFEQSWNFSWKFKIFWWLTKLWLGFGKRRRGIKMCRSLNCNLCLHVFCRHRFFLKRRRQKFFPGVVKTVTSFCKREERYKNVEDLEFQLVSVHLFSGHHFCQIEKGKISFGSGEEEVSEKLWVFFGKSTRCIKMWSTFTCIVCQYVFSLDTFFVKCGRLKFFLKSWMWGWFPESFTVFQE